MRKFLSVLFLFTQILVFSQDLSNKKMDGYRGIWFELNQKHPYGDKYSGALATYTAKHTPLAIYSPEANKTFFVFGGTTDQNNRYLLCMIGEYDHKKGTVSKPTVVFDKNGVDDPHDNPSLLIDNEGYLWVFVSGRNKSRLGYKYRSTSPFSIDKFEQVTEEIMTYPQPWLTGNGFFHFFTKYTGVRQLYYETSKDGITWTEDQMLAAIPEHSGEKSGHYQTSAVYDNRVVATFFNRHPNGDVDRRTDLYYLQSSDFGQSWTTAGGTDVEIPLTDIASPARAVDYASKGKNVYMKDMGFDKDGNPVCLYIRSNGHIPGPASAPYEWCITKWEDDQWKTFPVTNSDHNYDVGSLVISEEEWKIVGPTEKGPQTWGVGGEIAIWSSTDQGETWIKEQNITNNSPFSHSYVRKVINHRDPFHFFWADGDSHEFSKSELYFGNFNGEIWKLPYDMKKNYEKPIKVR